MLWPLSTTFWPVPDYFNEIQYGTVQYQYELDAEEHRYLRTYLVSLDCSSQAQAILNQESVYVVNYCLYRLESTSEISMECDIGRIETYKRNCSGNQPTMKSFYGSSLSALLPFLKEITVKFMAHCPNEQAAVRVVANFLEHEAKRLYASCTTSAVRLGNIRTIVAITWPRPFKAIILRYLTYDLLSPIYNEDKTIKRLTCENENGFADRLKAEAYVCTVFSRVRHSWYIKFGVSTQKIVVWSHRTFSNCP